MRDAFVFWVSVASVFVAILATEGALTAIMYYAIKWMGY